MAVSLTLEVPQAIMALALMPLESIFEGVKCSGRLAPTLLSEKISSDSAGVRRPLLFNQVS